MKKEIVDTLKSANKMATKEEQIKFFEELIKDREENARVIEKSSMEGVKGTVVEKYSDQAHFIYELLQNADDAKATKSEFYLTDRGLSFSHNGTILFSVTNPETEREDKKNNQLGHINSITSIGQSNKITESTIGKFGVGFKAVFQYTETPHIYDPNFWFKIERFIVPKLLEKDLENRKADETIFYFPFDKKEMPAEKAYEDILGKLKSLVYPTLFLSNLQEVTWETDNNESGIYLKEAKLPKNQGNIFYEKIELLQETGLEPTNEKLWLFTRYMEDSDHTYSVGLFLDDKGKLKPKQADAFCFFPTKENTGLNFIIHAPFLLTDSREGIKKNQTNNHNENLIKLLAELAADSLLIIKDLKLIDDDIINIIPYKESSFTNSIFKPFYSTIKSKFQNEVILPTSENGEYVSKKNAYWYQDKPIVDLFSNEQLQFLTNNINAKWIFIDLARNQTTGESEGYYPKIYPKQQFIDDCVTEHFEMYQLLQKITADFIREQPIEWLHKFYEYLYGGKNKKHKTPTNKNSINYNKHR